eukprot:CAMPEP_0171718536 /NCGR_PEP_ID=MMETSP0991-20121206/20669_1 /TAXON_ID=483369 /ORGANISM="non described non described, Strain CCMP2098" /LENGTH=47 /DNA_ID= /DNA_START= /DNA_END= /DNA_ORIENTATION=
MTGAVILEMEMEGSSSQKKITHLIVCGFSGRSHSTPSYLTKQAKPLE